MLSGMATEEEAAQPSPETAGSAARPGSRSPGSLCLLRLQASATAVLRHGAWGAGACLNTSLRGRPADNPGVSGTGPPFKTAARSEPGERGRGEVLR